MLFRIRFRVKNQPWFVSDTMPQDFDWVLNEMCSGAPNDIKSEKSENSDITPILVKYGEKWKTWPAKRVQEGRPFVDEAICSTFRFFL